MSEEKKRSIEPGTHKVKPKDWGFRETKAGNMQAYISFSNGATMYQNINANDTGDEILARSLTLCGFKGKELHELVDDKALNKNLEVEIFVKYAPNSETGKDQMSVYVNDAGKQMKGKLDKKEALDKFKGLNLSLKDQLEKAQSDIEVAEPKKETKTAESSSAEDDDSIPF